MTTDPTHDQARARLADLQRLKELMARRSAGGDTPIAITISRMPPEDRAEAEAILGRVGPIGEDPAIVAARRDMLLRIADWETTAQGIRDDPGTSTALRDHAAGTLANIAELRQALTGLPGPDDGGPDAH
jgi:hypothetical protein